MKIDRVNNFDLIRLLAAVQVVIFHTYEHLELENRVLAIIIDDFLTFFPGVPIFFFISGFLIYASFDRNSHLISKYIKNRFLRIFPALWVCTIITVILLVSTSSCGFGYLFQQNEFYLWIVGQVSIFQFYTPDLLRFWGVGTPNGSLWTIVVELQFYIIVPLIYHTLKFFQNKFVPLLVMFLFACLFNFFVDNIAFENVYTKLLGLSVFSFLHYFMIGITIYIYWSQVVICLKDKFWIWLIVYLAFMFVTRTLLGLPTASYAINSPLNVVADLLLAAVTMAAAFSYRSMSSRLLKGNDLSYGIYIYHMLIVNFLVYYGYKYDMIYLILTLGIVAIVAIVSWKFVERPALLLK